MRLYEHVGVVPAMEKPMPFFDVNNLERRQMLPGCVVRLVHADNMTISYWDLEPGAVAVIGSNVEHSVKALRECYVIDAFYPVRDDYR